MSGLSGTAERFGELLAAAGGESTPGDLAAAAGVAKTAQAAALRQLREAGLVDGSPKAPRLTPAGWSRFSEAAPVGAGAALEDALQLWSDVGLYAHRAFLELLLSATVARHHLAAVRPEPHLGFMAIGESGTGKSSLVRMACELLGLDFAAHEVMLGDETEGSVFGRRAQREGGWAFEPSALTRLPLVFLDEFDKADEPVRRAAWRYFQGAARVRGEDGIVPLTPTAVLGANPPRRGERLEQLRTEYRRRSVVLDTGYAVPRVRQLQHALSASTRPLWAPLALDGVQVPATELPAGPRAIIESVREVLTDAGAADLPDSRALELAALGRAALLGPDSDLGIAAYATVMSYLQVAETVPGLATDWNLPLGAIRAAYAEIGADVDLRDLERAAQDAVRGRELRNQEARKTRVARVGAGIELTGARGELVGRLLEASKAIEQLPSDLRPRGRGIRAQLAELRKRAGDTRSAEGLAEVADLSAGPLAAAGALAHDVAARRLANARDKEQAAEHARQAKVAQRGHAADQKTQAAQLAAQLADVMKTVTELEKLYRRSRTKPDEVPLKVLLEQDLGGYRLLVYETSSQPAAPRSRGLGVRLLDELTGGAWRSPLDPSVAFRGKRDSCAALAEWGPNTRAVLAPAIVALRQAEDQLRAQLDRKPRNRFPVTARSTSTPWAGRPITTALELL